MLTRAIAAEIVRPLVHGEFPLIRCIAPVEEINDTCALIALTVVLEIGRLDSEEIGALHNLRALLTCHVAKDTLARVGVGERSNAAIGMNASDDLLGCMVYESVELPVVIRLKAKRV